MEFFSRTVGAYLYKVRFGDVMILGREIAPFQVAFFSDDGVGVRAGGGEEKGVQFNHVMGARIPSSLWNWEEWWTE